MVGASSIQASSPQTEVLQATRRTTDLRIITITGRLSFIDGCFMCALHYNKAGKIKDAAIYSSTYMLMSKTFTHYHPWDWHSNFYGIISQVGKQPCNFSPYVSITTVWTDRLSIQWLDHGFHVWLAPWIKPQTPDHMSYALTTKPYAPKNCKMSFSNQVE